MISITNVSSSRTISHEDGGVVFTLGPNMTMDFENQVGEAILSGWPIAKANGEEKPNLARTPWEYSAGPTWEKAKLENKLMEHAVQKATVGADRPAVVEPPVPQDAIDVDSGKVIEAKLNTHVCNMCEKPYKQLGALRTHQRKEHNV